MGLTKHTLLSYLVILITMTVVASGFKATDWRYWVIVFGLSFFVCYREWIERQKTISDVKKNFLGMMPAFTENKKFVNQFKMWSDFVDKALNKSK
jgi:hypothetical protein